jgi:hypothetical protein
MRVTILPSDGFVSIDGQGLNGMDLSFIDSSIHAIQWYGTEGEIERKDSRGRITANEQIDSIDQFQQAIDTWNSTKLQIEADEAARIEAENLANAEAEAIALAMSQSSTSNN